ncbi:dsDNA nuclease domain-containing protein [Catellatospora chokoriensis]|uniref:CD-NTase associated protein 4-like DNA endonuclease domain-containing protein n=1 Tax=Catellatospora chokoriensis TaxID=310353 RepID=A0A8J3NT67_9ACTN|nr:dsDNA nuclease domain-containing protein [Catellatospora chokoriensis]GIF91391.1 hypothetical protein Cch02nite_48350 [Catellatospora chokoriensis]
MTEADVAAARDLWERAGQLSGDRSGVDTFSRYTWQAKQTVLQWLTCLPDVGGPYYVICEHIDDIILVYPRSLKFMQLKTRDRGSWTAVNMCDSGFDSLVRSYKKAKEKDLHLQSTFELWLEGPISEVKATVAFVEDPTTADAKVCKKLRTYGLSARELTDFLQRLRIEPGQPSRANMDATALWKMTALWPGTSSGELKTVYERLLEAATAAQEAADQPASITALLGTRLADPPASAPMFEDMPTLVPLEVRRQTLTRSVVFALCPPLPNEHVDVLMQRLAAGQGTSMLELKMRAGSASHDRIQEAQGFRAEMDVERQLLLASRANAEEELERLAHRTLTYVRAVATRVALDGAVNPTQAHRPAETIAATLLANPADLSQCDRNALFSRDPFLLYGYIAHLSDECRFPWRPA